MGNKSKQVTQNTPGFATPPATQATTNLQNLVDTPTDFATPIRNNYARAEQNLNRSYNNPLGSYTTADVRDKSSRASHLDLQQNLGLDLSNAAQQSSADKFNRQATVAGLTSPKFYNAQSSTSQPWTTGDSLGLASSVGSSLLT